MANPSRSLILFSSLSLVSNCIGAWVSIQRGLAADFGGFLNGHDVVRDFIGINGTALSAPLIFLVLQAVFIALVPRAGRLGGIGLAGLIVLGAIYTLAQLGEPIVLRMLQPATFDPLEALILVINEALAILMLVYGLLERRARRKTVHR